MLLYFLFDGTDIRGCSQKIRGYSLECPGLTTRLLPFKPNASTLVLMFTFNAMLITLTKICVVRINKDLCCAQNCELGSKV